MRSPPAYHADLKCGGSLSGPLAGSCLSWLAAKLGPKSCILCSIGCSLGSVLACSSLLDTDDDGLNNPCPDLHVLFSPSIFFFFGLNQNAGEGSVLFDFHGFGSRPMQCRTSNWHPPPGIGVTTRLWTLRKKVYLAGFLLHTLQMIRKQIRRRRRSPWGLYRLQFIQW